ncbi:serine/threonine-protein kinase 10-like [Cloeon dipterum]|uniref:serine/threonine-protein kinase 10-like n=1 Tax=Cloeon dipterum TaxID=197152 RepID=UPI0032202AF1
MAMVQLSLIKEKLDNATEKIGLDKVLLEEKEEKLSELTAQLNLRNEPYIAVKKDVKNATEQLGQEDKKEELKDLTQQLEQKNELMDNLKEKLENATVQINQDNELVEVIRKKLKNVRAQLIRERNLVLNLKNEIAQINRTKDGCENELRAIRKSYAQLSDECQPCPKTTKNDGPVTERIIYSGLPPGTTKSPKKGPGLEPFLIIPERPEDCYSRIKARCQRGRARAASGVQVVSTS